jgi:hypothetical protein
MALRIFLGLVVVLLLGAVGGVLLYFLVSDRQPVWPFRETYTVEHTEYQPPEPGPEELLTDDRIEDKKPLPFDPVLVDRRPLGNKGEWLINASAAVIRLDVPLIKPDTDASLLTLHPSYAAAAGANPDGRNILPSVNLLDGKAKQFDDGLYAALDLAYYKGLKGTLASHVGLVRRLYDKLGKDSVAAPYLAAGLELAGMKVDATNREEKDRLLAAFNASEVRSKPIGFYTWNEELSAVFRFLRFFQQPFSAEELPIALALAQAMEQDGTLLADYQKAMGFYARLTNPYRRLTVADLTAAGGKKVPRGDDVALFPGSTSKETVLFEKLFPLGLPPEANLMKELIGAIRSGKVDLRPGPNSGWYDHQAYALETLLLPEKGQEKDKLLLTKAYKKRMLEAFQALITKRRETHVRQLDIPLAASAPPPPLDKVKPRLRVEPNPTYYLRTARAYSFLATFLEAAVGPDALKTLHGLKKEGARAKDLFGELNDMRDLFYGFYLVSCEDIGLKPEFAKEEKVDQERCYKLATTWLPKAFADEDLAVDTRVAVPVYVDPGRGIVRVWMTLGVRLAKLEASYARPPHVKPANGSADWKEVESYKLEPAHYLIPVDEFAEVELRGLRVLSREELRAVCDREKTKEAIIEALKR